METNTVDTKVIELQRQVQKLEKLEKMINPNSKKSLILWEEDDNFKSLIAGIVEYSKTYTDFDTLYKQNGGIPSTLISIPLRYMHSSVEVGSLKYVEYTINLLVEFIKELDDKVSFDPFK